MCNFKDRCDNCNKFAILKGYNNKCFCLECMLKELEERKVINLEGIERIKALSADITDKPLLKIIEYLLSRADMDEKYLNEEKSLSQMIQFIKSEAQKQAVNNVAMIEDEQVYNWAIHYFDESNENLGLNKTPEKVEKKEEKISPSYEEYLNSHDNKTSKKKEYVSEGQLTLF